MSKRVTIIIDDDLYRKLRTIQAREIIQNSKEGTKNRNNNFSRIVNITLRKKLMK